MAEQTTTTDKVRNDWAAVASLADTEGTPRHVRAADRLWAAIEQLRAAALPLPEPVGTIPDGGDPYWTLPEGLESGGLDDATETLTASVAGVSLNDALHPDVDDLEQVALTMLAAIRAHRALKEAHSA